MKYGGRPRPLADSLGRVTKKALGRRGFAAGDILAHWPAIVGERLAQDCLPQRLRRPRRTKSADGPAPAGTLEIRAASALATELQHLEPQVVERINGFFGFRAVARIKIVHGPLPRQPAPPRPRDRIPAQALAPEVAAQVAAVEDEALRDALEALGRSVGARAPDAS